MEKDMDLEPTRQKMDQNMKENGLMIKNMGRVVISITQQENVIQVNGKEN